MKKMKFMAAAAAAVMGITAVSVSFPVLQVSANDSDVKILCLGDSITDGYFGRDGYRKYLYHELDEMGYSIDMVGAKSGGSSYTTSSGETFKYDGDHSGYSGYSIENISGGYESRQGIRELVEGTWYSGGKNMIQAYDPDIVLLQIGTNDILSAYNDGITDRLENLVNIILNDMNDPDDVLYIASIPYIDAYVRGDWLGGYGFNVWGSTDEEKTQLMEKVSSCVDSYNASIEDMVARMQSEGKPVAFGDINSVVNYETDLEDGCHPNETGYEKMGTYWANLLAENYFDGNENIETKPVETTTTTTITTTEITTTKPETSTTTESKVTTAPVTQTTVASTLETTAPVQPTGDDIVLEDVAFGKTYDLSAYKGMGINEVSFVFESMPPYGMNGCAVFGNWELSKNYTADDLSGLSLNVELDKEYSSLTLHKWYGETNLSKIILKTANSSDETTESTTTTTTTAKPTTTTTTSTTTTTAKPTTTTTTSTTTTTAKPTTTTTTSTTTTTAKPTTTTTTSTTAVTTKPATTTTITTTTNKDDENTVVLKDVVLGKEYSLKDYDYKSISKIVIKWNGDVGYGFGGSLVLGSWTVQNSYGHNDMAKDGTIEFAVDNPQDKFTLFRYWGSVELESVTLYFD